MSEQSSHSSGDTRRGSIPTMAETMGTSLDEFRRTQTEVDVLQRVEAAARRISGLVGGVVGNWKLDGRKVTDEAGEALISLVAYLNDLDAWRSR